jgi:DNA-directed RNA polymerase subunit RPC12/RpoP
VLCDCGRQINVKDEFAGKLIRCPLCKNPVQVPAAAPPPPPANEPIDVFCTCGRHVRVKADFAGKLIRCPQCKSPVQVPAPDPIPEVEAAEMELSDDDVVDDDAPAAGITTRRRSALEDAIPTQDDEAPPPPKPRRRSSRDRYDRDYVRHLGKPKPSGNSDGWGINAGVGGGCLMMVLAVVWFVVGWFAGWIFFYPPILFILGLIAFIRGLMGESD